MGPVKVYLVLYNFIQTFLWSYALLLLIQPALKNELPEQAYASGGEIVALAQLFSLLEVLHAALGFVRSNWGLNLLQWAGRSHCLFAVVRPIPELHGTWPVYVMLMAWSLSEVIRYPQYMLSQLGRCPSWLTWLRYTAFIVLYPAGVWGGEIYVMYMALPYVKERKFYEDVFQDFPVGYDRILLSVITIVEPVAWFRLYTYMLNQRFKRLSPEKEAKEAKGEKAN